MLSLKSIVSLLLVACGTALPGSAIPIAQWAGDDGKSNAGLPQPAASQAGLTAPGQDDGPPAGSAGGMPQQDTSDYPPPDRRRYQHGLGLPAQYRWRLPYGYSSSSGQYRLLAPATESWAPPGLVIPLTLETALSSRSSRDGDHVAASVCRNVALEGCGYIPAGTQVTGRVTEAKGAGFMLHQGSLSLCFDRMQFPDGRTFPISAHMLGGMGEVGDGDIPYSDVHGSQGWRQRMEQMGVESAVGNVVEGGAGLSGFVEGGGYNLLRGGNPLYGLSALTSGTTVMGLFQVAGGLLRHGRNVIVPAGTQFQIRLDSGLTVAGFAGQAGPG